MLQEEGVDKLRTDLEAAREEVAGLRVRLAQSETMLRSVDNNNRTPCIDNNRSGGSSEDTLYRVIASLEALATQVNDEETRVKLENIVKMGKQS